MGLVVPGKKLPCLFEDSDEEEECSVAMLQVRVCVCEKLIALMTLYPLMEIACAQVNTEEWALQHLKFLQSILNPFLEGYWNTIVALLQMESTTEGENSLYKACWC